MVQMTTISSKGQLVIPAALRRKYRLKSGSQVAVEDRDGHIALTPNPYDALLAMRGILKHAGEDAEAWLMKEKLKDREREERKAQVLR
jgi:AbrB family looped-hinge helix DNA binding protein